MDGTENLEGVDMLGTRLILWWWRDMAVKTFLPLCKTAGGKKENRQKR
jgi:hypothetical protein